MEDKGVLHNDIKPANILYGRDLALARRSAKLIDFGLAQEEAGSMVLGGTCWYVPGELAEGRRGYPADIWSLGVSMLYLRKYIKLPEKPPQDQWWDLGECRGGRVPKQMSRWLEMIRDLRSDIQASCLQNNREGSELDLIICKMLEKDASDRITRSELAQQTRKWREEIVAAEG